MAVYEFELDAFAQTGEQRRPVTGKDRLHKELVLVDQPRSANARGSVTPPTHRPSPRTSSASQSTPLSVLDTTHFVAWAMVSANEICHSSIQFRARAPGVVPRFRTGSVGSMRECGRRDGLQEWQGPVRRMSAYTRGCLIARHQSLLGRFSG